MNIRKVSCGCEIVGTGTPDNPLQIEFCPLHHDQQGTIAVSLVRMEQLKEAIQERDWPATEFQFDRVLRSLTKQKPS